MSQSVSHSVLDDGEVHCPTCSFLNHPENDQCTMCGYAMHHDDRSGRGNRLRGRGQVERVSTTTAINDRELTSALFNFSLRGGTAVGGGGGADTGSLNSADLEGEGSSRRGGRGGRGRDRDRDGNGGDRGRGGSGRGRGGRERDRDSSPSRGGRGRGGRGDNGHGGHAREEQEEVVEQDPEAITRQQGTWTLQTHHIPQSTSHAGAPSTASTASASAPAHAAAATSSDATVAPQPKSDPSSIPAEGSGHDASTTEDDESLSNRDQQHIRYERTLDGGVIRRSANPSATAAAASASALSAATSPSPQRFDPNAPSAIPQQIDLRSIGFESYRWRTSSRMSTGKLTILCVAEKPSIALTLANALSGGSHSTRSGSGSGSATPVHEFSYPFRGCPANYRVTSVAGHLSSIDFVDESFKDWYAVDPATLFNAAIAKTVERRSLASHLEAEARGSDVLILWMDCDREGENICFETMEHTVHALNQPRAGSDMNKPHRPFLGPKEKDNVGEEGGGSGSGTSTTVDGEIDESEGSIPGNVFRAHFSALSLQDFKQALDTLRVPDVLASRSVDARQEIDLRIGVAFTRFQTLYFLARYGSALPSRIISYGPCQTPTLGFCVRRHTQIETFVTEKYWQIEIKVRPAPHVRAQLTATGSTKDSTAKNVLASSFIQDGGASSSGSYHGGSASASSPDSILIPLAWDRGSRLFSQQAGEFFHARFQASSSGAVVTSVTTSHAKRSRPLALNTVSLLKVCSKALGIGPADAMRVAEHLYLAGFISYPRTETTSYASTFDVASVVRMQTPHNEWGEYAAMLLEKGVARGQARRGTDVGDHPPITPTRLAQPGQQLSGVEWRVYEYVVRHFLASVSEDETTETITTRFQIAKTEGFTTTSTHVVNPGFTIIMPWLQRTDDIPLGYSVGDVVPLAHLSLNERLTTPPSLLTESDLIGLMESHGIGTDASIPMHIKSIIDRGYVTLGSGRTLKPSSLGCALIHGYDRIDPDLSAPYMRASVEMELDNIAKGLHGYRGVLRHLLTMFARKYAYFIRQINKMDLLFGAHFGDGPAGEHGGGHGGRRSKQLDPLYRERVMTQCGRCKRFMRLIPLPSPPKLYCAHCEEVYQLPSGGVLKKWQGRSCPLDGFELLLFSTSSHGNVHGFSYSLCPYCYNHPPFIDDPNVPSFGMGCNQCMHPSCRFALPTQAITRCPESEGCGGYLTIDPTGGPNWQLGCNRCNVIITFAKSAYKVVVQDSRCQRCQARLLEINFHKDFNPLRSVTQHRRR